jgi:hypothetical protein
MDGPRTAECLVEQPQWLAFSHGNFLGRKARQTKMAAVAATIANAVTSCQSISDKVADEKRYAIG